MSQSRQLAAIMFTDIVGYTALMQQDESKAVAVIKHYNSTLEKWVAHFNGQILNYYGDGSLCIFSSATDAVNCSLAVQKELKIEPVVPLRIGLHIGEVFFEDAKALGDGVNVASRVQSLGQENTILISEEVYDKIKNNAAFAAASLGHFDFKNVGKAMEVFALTNEGLFVPQRKKMEGKLKKKNSQKRNIIIALSLLLLIVTAFFIYRNFFVQNEEIADKSIAVLPFVDMSAAKDQEYFSDGLSEELLNLLAKIPELKVIGRTSSFSFKGKNEDLRIIAQKLGVAHILEGSVRKDGNNIRVTAQLIKASDGSHLWSESFDRNLEGLFKLQDEIAGAVVKQLKLKLFSIPPTTASSNIEVHNLILQGNYFFDKLDKENVAKAIELYLKALAIDSTDARAWASLANAYARQGWQKYENKTGSYKKARQAATKAISIDNNLAAAHAELGDVKMYHDMDWKGAEEAYNIALNLDPGNTGLLMSKGNLYQILGQHHKAIELSEKVITVDPLRPLAYLYLGTNLMYAGNLIEAEKAFKKAIELNPQFQRMHMYLGRIYLMQGKNELALKEMQQETDSIFKSFGLALAYYVNNKKTESDLELEQFIIKNGDVWKFLIAEIYSFRGNKEKAIEWLNKAYNDNDNWMIGIKDNPLFKNLEGDPRHKEILQKMNLPTD